MRRLQSVVVISGLGSLACGGAAGLICPSQITAGEGCWLEEQYCGIPGQEDGCGLNGHECRDGQWRESFTYCNPPSPPEEEPTTAPPPAE